MDYRSLREDSVLSWGTTVQHDYGVDDRELTFSEIKNLATNHSLVCKALKTKLAGLVESVKKQPVLAQLNNGRYVIVIKFSSEPNAPQNVTIIDPKAATPKAETIEIEKFTNLWAGTGLIFKNPERFVVRMAK